MGGKIINTKLKASQMFSEVFEIILPVSMY